MATATCCVVLTVLSKIIRNSTNVLQAAVGTTGFEYLWEAWRAFLGRTAAPSQSCEIGQEIPKFRNPDKLPTFKADTEPKAANSAETDHASQRSCKSCSIAEIWREFVHGRKRPILLNFGWNIKQATASCCLPRLWCWGIQRQFPDLCGNFRPDFRNFGISGQIPTDSALPAAAASPQI